ncbi:hypothetical protein CROQUDRAFT_95940 [Cronartium quercuum f. sp. fusiforme G11]|uniref:Uncharacterized protein n=1 Tax=Cronartium quercuum f. sp. fusiforme G11 TaxID=708437 RepID=A0A9P6NGC7_9BASI|nr:hypothetical protein CROQUDRAFT_95940 [Cronartium quercuum f. sp. fusiforme G11]
MTQRQNSLQKVWDGPAHGPSPNNSRGADENFFKTTVPSTIYLRPDTTHLHISCPCFTSSAIIYTTPPLLLFTSLTSNLHYHRSYTRNSPIFHRTALPPLSLHYPTFRPFRISLHYHLSTIISTLHRTSSSLPAFLQYHRPTLSPISVTTVHFNRFDRNDCSDSIRSESDPTPIRLDLINRSNRSNSIQTID